MFTLKLYQDVWRTRIVEAESFTINRAEDGSRFEITCHMANPLRDCRFDIGEPGPGAQCSDSWTHAIIENANGRTTEKLVPQSAKNCGSAGLARAA